MKKILHLISAQAPQAATLTKGLLSDAYSKFDNVCVLYGKTNDECSSASIIFPTREDSIYHCENICDLFSVLKKNRCNFVVCHGDSYVFRVVPLLIGCKVSWVCWGSHTNTSGSILSYLSYPVKFIINHSLYRVVALMLPDRDNLAKTFKLKKIQLLPYPSYPDKQLMSQEFFNTQKREPLRVLIGNSGHCYPWYKEIIKSLEKFRGKIEIHCMFQYPQLPQLVSELQIFGRERFDDYFHVDTEYMNRGEYFQYLSSFDIYICPKPTQSGLGAIHTSLLFGKKVYLTGKNLEWENYLGTKVFDVAKITNSDIRDFSKDLSMEEKEHNRLAIIKHWDRLEEWIEFYDSL